MTKSLRLFGVTVLMLVAFATQATAAESYAVLPFKITSVDQYQYMGVSVPQMISSRLYVKDKFQPVAKTTVVDQSSLSSESDAAKAQGSMRADYVIWGDMEIRDADCEMNVYARNKAGKMWSRHVRTKINNMNPKIQELSAAISQDVFGYTAGTGVTAIPSQNQAPIRETQNQLNPDLVVNEDGVRDVYLNPNIRYAGNTDDSGSLRTPTLPFPSVDFDIADLDGDGRNEIVLIENHAIHVYRYENGKMVDLASDQMLLMNNNLSVRVFNPGVGRPKIIVNSQDDRAAASGYVYVFDGKNLKQEAKNIPYYMNVVTLPDMKQPTLIGQYGDVQRVFKGGIYEMMKAADGKYMEGTRLDMPEKVNALNFTWMPYTRDTGPLLVALTDEERLRVFGKGGNRLFETEEKYSGSYVGIEQTNQIRGMGKDRTYLPDKYYIPERMLVADLEGRGEYVLLINKPSSTAAQIFERYRFFPQGEIHALYWDGVGLNLKWKTRRIKGSVIDISLVDFNNDGIKDLVVGINTHPGAVGLSERKTMFIGYPLDISRTDPNTAPDATEFIHNN